MNNQLRCIIVEDEPLAAEILSEYISQTPFLNLTHICNDAIQALDVVRAQPVDVIFLDINLPKLSGLEFVKTLLHPPKVIVTSAYHEFAVQGFDLQVVDYLLKPIEFSRFTKAVNKQLQPHRASDLQAVSKPAQPVRAYYFFTVSKRSVKIYLDEILFIESLKDSVSIVTKARAYNTHYQLGELEELMRSDNFLRIHRSFLVAVDKSNPFPPPRAKSPGAPCPSGAAIKNM